MIEDVFSAENVLVDIQNMTLINNITGNQYLKIVLQLSFILRAEYKSESSQISDIDINKLLI